MKYSDLIPELPLATRYIQLNQVANNYFTGTSSEVSIPAYSSHGYGTIIHFGGFAAHYKDRLTHGHHRGRTGRKEGLQPPQARRD